MTDPDIEAAISAALSFDWQKALEINHKILENYPDDADCLNRIGKAYLELGQSKKAASFFKRVLKINRYDPIALRNLTRASQASFSKKNGHQPTQPNNNHSAHTIISFLEEPGRTKIISLVNLAPAKILLFLNTADQLLLIPKRHSVFVENSEGIYLGSLPDDLAHRLLILIKGGNKYESFVKSCSKNSLSIFIKETVKSKRFHNTPSFPTSGGDYLSFVREEVSEDSKASSAVTESNDETESDDTSFTKNQLHQDEEEEES